MKKKLLLLSLTLVLAFSGVVYAAGVNGQYKGKSIVRVTMDGREVKPDGVPGYLEGANTMVPLGMLRKMGFTVEWDAKTLTANVKKSDSADPVELTNEIISNHGGGVTLVKEDGAMIALSFLQEIKDYDSDWYYFDQIFQRLSKFNANTSRVVYTNAQGDEIGSVSIESQVFRDHLDGKVTDEVLQSKWVVTGKLGRVPLTSKEIGRLKNAVGMVITYDANGNPLAQGSGFVINDMIFITNHHVIEGAKKIAIKLDGVNYDASHWFYFDNKDLDLFAVLLSSSYDSNGSATGTAPAHSLPYSTDLPEIGDKIYTIGSPQGFENTLSEGIVSSIRTDGGMKYIQHTANTDHGSSGGALLNEFGEVIGVTAMGIDGTPLDFAIPMMYVQQELEKLRK